MVKASDAIPRLDTGAVDHATWSGRVAADLERDVAPIMAALDLIRGLEGRSEEFLEKGIELANLVLTLNMDVSSIAAALLYRPVRAGSLSLAEVRKATDEDVAGLLEAVVRMADTSLLEMSNSKMQTSESRDQIENIKRMLVSMIDDARVAILKLAERVVALRAAKNSTEERKMRIAQEAHQVFGPLANRLGVWQLKWELEDLSLRYLAPEIYKAIAGQLNGRRVEREAEIDAIVERVQERLAAKGITAVVRGRAKHIFSIWRKMRAKQVGLQEVYDVRAIRVLVPDIAQCYAALGIIHTEWQHVPSEFDDYVAVPKENGYRSIHTAVSWDDGKTLEVQIRTQQMHEESELGVCAHWAYKDQGSEDEYFSQKMDWMRQVVEWQEETEEHIRQAQIGAELGQRIREERIFVYTPKGHVLDLTTGATALDFAYRVHTEIGHRCRGARIDGKDAALNTPLNSGQRVEVLTGEEAVPRREWLHHHLDCIRTARAREKISDWFRNRPQEVNAQEGLALLKKSFTRLGLPFPGQAALATAAKDIGYDAVDQCLAALGSGECDTHEVLAAVLHDDAIRFRPAVPPAQMSLLDETAGTSKSADQEQQGSFRVTMIAADRTGLLMDIAAVLAKGGITLISNTGRLMEGTDTASIDIEVRLGSLVELDGLMDSLELIPGVVSTRSAP